MVEDLRSTAHQCMEEDLQGTVHQCTVEDLRSTVHQCIVEDLRSTVHQYLKKEMCCESFIWSREQNAIWDTGRSDPGFVTKETKIES